MDLTCENTLLYPALLMNDIADVRVGNPVDASQLALCLARCCAMADLTNDKPGQTTLRITFARLISAVPDFILLILSVSAPAKIYERGILLASRTVTAHLPGRTRFSERPHDQQVHLVSPLTAIFTQPYHGISMAAVQVLQHFPAADSAGCLPGQRAYPAQVTHFIQSLVPGYRQPALSRIGHSAPPSCVRPGRRSGQHDRADLIVTSMLDTPVPWAEAQKLCRDLGIEPASVRSRIDLFTVSGRDGLFTWQQQLSQAILEVL